MAGVLERIGWPQKKPVAALRPLLRVDPKILELQAAKEILAEIFGVRISDVEEMIQNRYDEVRCVENSYEEEEQWPREFRVGE